MAFFYMRTSVIKANQGKSAVASAAYMSGSSLYSERLGRTFSYNNKEEVAHAEINFCENAPSKLRSRLALWNEVEKVENRSNSKLARCFIIALPKEWTKEECIEYSREFIQKAFVDKGMCADWAFHMKDNNPHLHVQTTVRAFTENGKWAQSEKKEYVLDENGNKIPELDENGNQKIRVRVRNGRTSTERLWKRQTIQRNPWDNKQFLRDVKKDWSEIANKYLPLEQHIDGRSYKERKLNRVPLLHEDWVARKALERGEIYEVVRENQERRALNEQLTKLEKLLEKAKEKFKSLKERCRKYKEKIYEQRRSGFNGRTTTIGSGTNRDATGFDIVITRRNRRNLQFQEINDRKEELEKKITNRQPYRGM